MAYTQRRPDAPKTGRTVRLGGGQVVPYPEPTSAAATTIGRANRRVDSRAEVALRCALHHLGLRFRVDPLVRAEGTKTHPDIVFGPVRLAVFVDGCFWHCCPAHIHMPKSNLAYWEPKLAANVVRDRRVDQALVADGWSVLRVWEHERVEVAVRAVVDALIELGHEPADRARSVLGTTDPEQ